MNIPVQKLTGPSLVAFLFFLLPSFVGQAAVLTLAPSADAYISEHFAAPTGTQAELIIGTQGNNDDVDFAKNRGLVRFAGVSQIPPGATITSVRVTINVTKAPLGAPASTFQLHRLLQEWDDGECSWFLRLEPDGNWGEPGGASGSDYVATSSASRSIAGPGAYTFDSTAALVADVTHWVNQPAENQGWLVKQEDESTPRTARRVAATGGILPGPTLEVNYEVATPFRIASAGLSGQQLCLQFDAKAGKSYVVEGRADLVDGQWGTVTNLPVFATAQVAVVCEQLTTGNRFYRVGER